MQVTKTVKAAKKPAHTEQAKKAQVSAGEKAQGEAIAESLVNTLSQHASVEEGHKTKLSLFVENLKTLTHNGHLGFRARLDAESATYNAMKKAMQTSTKGKTALAEDSILGAYGFASIPVRLTQWRSISKALDFGMKIPVSANFNKIVSECVAFNRAHAAGDASGGAAPSSRKGRKETPFAEKAAKFIEGLDTEQLQTLAALVQKALEIEPALV